MQQAQAKWHIANDNLGRARKALSNAEKALATAAEEVEAASEERRGKPIVCPICKGKGEALSIDGINSDGTLINPRKSSCFVCDGTGTAIPD
jgi:DnaJ-class molecular chaperone